MQQHFTWQYLPERPPTSWGRQNFFVANSQTEQCRSAIPTGCVQYFVPGSTVLNFSSYVFKNLSFFAIGHLPRKLEEYKRRYRSLATTYVTFDPTGRYLLANIGGEHIYLYDIYTPKQPFSELPEFGIEEPKEIALPSQMEQLKCKANAAFQQRQFTTAIGLYSKALLRSPKAAVLYSNRAAALLRRNW